MSHLIRFKDDDNVYIKVRIFERSSARRPCKICGRRMFGILIRHIEPKKLPDSVICDECLANIALGRVVSVEDGTSFGKFSEKKIITLAGRRKPLKHGPKKTPKVKCPQCGKVCAERGLAQHVTKMHPLPVKPDVTIDDAENAILYEKPNIVKPEVITKANERLVIPVSKRPRPGVSLASSVPGESAYE